MMPRCYHKSCRQTGTEYFGKVWNGEVHGNGQREEDPIYLCPKHANKLRQMLCMNFEENKWNEKLIGGGADLHRPQPDDD